MGRKFVLITIIVKKLGYKFKCPICGKAYRFALPSHVKNLVLPMKNCFNCHVPFPAIGGLLQWEDARIRYHRSKTGVVDVKIANTSE